MRPEPGHRQPAPLWFAAAAPNLLSHRTAVSRPISVRAATAGTVSAIADPDAGTGLAWEHILNIINVALLMAIAIALLASLAIARIIAPARSIMAAILRMAARPVPNIPAGFPIHGVSMTGRAVTDLFPPLLDAMPLSFLAILERSAPRPFFYCLTYLRYR